MSLVSRSRAAIAAACLIAGTLLSAGGALAADWPQWRGPARDAISRETGLLKSWPAEGPRLLWKATGLGGGYSAPSVAGKRVYGMSYRGDDEVVWALDEATGKEVWRTVIARANKTDIGYPEGSRCTPTVDGGKVYAVGASGDLVCLDTSGRILWRKSLVKDFGGQIPGWGFTESPLIDGEKLIVTPGGASATLVALNKNTGEVIWKSAIGDPAHYSSAIIADAAGKRQYIQFLSGGVVGVSAQDGKLLWRYDRPANRTANISTPIYSKDHVFAASAYRTGGGLAKLTANGEGIEAKEVYFTRQMQNHHGGMVLVKDHLYGFDESNLTCIHFATGEVAWSNRSVGKGSLAAADGLLFVRGERGPVALVEANPAQYVEKSRFEQPDRSTHNAWPHPVIANGRLYLRDQDVLLCYDVKGGSEGSGASAAR